MANTRCKELLRECIALTMENWTALQLALDHGMGGQHGFTMARKLPDFLMTILNQSGSVSAEDISNELFDFMDTHMKTECEDGSCEELGDIIWNLFQLCKTENHVELEKEVQNLAHAHNKKQKGLSREVTINEDVAIDAVPMMSISEDISEDVDSSCEHMEESPKFPGNIPAAPTENGDSEWTEVTRRRRRL